MRFITGTLSGVLYNEADVEWNCPQPLSLIIAAHLDNRTGRIAWADESNCKAMMVSISLRATSGTKSSMRLPVWVKRASPPVSTDAPTTFAGIAGRACPPAISGRAFISSCLGGSRLRSCPAETGHRASHKCSRRTCLARPRFHAAAGVRRVQLSVGARTHVQQNVTISVHRCD